MSLDMMQTVAALAVPSNEERRAALRTLLEQKKIPYRVQEGMSKPEKQTGVLFSRAPVMPEEIPVQNLVVSLGEGTEPKLVIGAHYDTHEGSTGANDNASGVSILAALAEELCRWGLQRPIDLVFFDREEEGRAGSKYYLAQLSEGEACGMVNLDVCGYGDTLCVRAHKITDPLAPFMDKKRLAAHGGKAVCYLPESDDLTFSKGHIPSASVAVMPQWDAAILPAMREYANSFFGIPPELRDQLADMEIMSTLHGGPRDKIDYISPGALQRTYEYLLDALSVPVIKRNFFQKMFAK